MREQRGERDEEILDWGWYLKESHKLLDDIHGNLLEIDASVHRIHGELDSSWARQIKLVEYTGSIGVLLWVQIAILAAILWRVW